MDQIFFFLNIILETSVQSFKKTYLLCSSNYSWNYLKETVSQMHRDVSTDRDIH